MSKQAVPPIPHNFEVWFNYSTGSVPDLNKTIDILINSRKRFDASTNRDLFQTYIRSHGDAVTGEVSAQLQAALDTARTLLGTAITDNRSQIHALGDVATQIERSEDTRAIIASLINALSRAATRAAALEEDLTRSSQEIEQIRASLQHAEERASTDGLTGLANRRTLDDFLRSAQIAAMEYGQDLSILLLDIDRFKSFNDRFGHQVGDQVLRLTAELLGRFTGITDLAARYGGEELIAVFTDTAIEDCMKRAERLRCAIADCRITRRSTGEVLPGITVSIGVARFRPGEAIEQTIERCDRALYRAKTTGRNRTVMEFDDEPVPA
ncbi:GGDEF domain-containing protein [Bradyrhizobium sp. 2TAF24]|uniref:GGDEF domain-containing protein n=1 Tax=Bradyrhizobium sp. 2TAF24 TaxID=3233011 RepID=UPI003F8F9E22